MRPRRVGEILDGAVKVYVRNARTLMGLALVVIIPVQLITAVVLLSVVPSGSDVPNGSGPFGGFRQQTVPDPAAFLGADAVLIVLGGIGSALITAACVKAVSDAYLDHPTGIGISLRFAGRRLAAVIGMEILLSLGLVLAFIALIIPGIWLYASWSVAMPALLVEGRGPASSLGRSLKLVQGRWWPTAGVLLVSYVLVTIVSAIVQGLLSAVAALPSHPSVVLAVVVATLSGTVGAVISNPFRAAVTTILYYDLRVRKEGYDLQVLADQLGLPAGTLSADQPAGWGEERVPAGDQLPYGPEAVGRPGGPPFWPPPPGWRP
jgi:hypothetical protein